ncbi:MAG: FAD-binding oxidoreductase [Pseudomonadota bacterium]
MTLRAANADFEAILRSDLPGDTFVDATPGYSEEPRGRWSGNVGILAKPRDVHEVSALVRHASEHGVPVVPYSGGTGLVGGQVMPDGPAPLLISTERLNAVRAIYPNENVLIAEAGVILADVQQAAMDADRLFPLSLAAEGTARIGGNLSTNAGGLGVLRYGNARDLCLGIEAVLPDGTILNGLSRLRKDNTGYDLRHLLIGAEGSLGLITAAALKLFAQPAATCTGFLVVPDPAAALTLLNIARDHLGENISAFELIHRRGFEFLTHTLPEVRQPFQTPPEWSVLLDIGVHYGEAQDELSRLLELGMTRGIVTDGLIAQSQSQAQEFWRVRETIPEANRLIGSVSSHDISLPLGNLAAFITKADACVATLGPFRVNCFGHVGDGNLHYNVFPPPGKSRADFLQEREKIKRALHDLVDEFDGSVSAEHGIGRLKVDDLERYGDPAKLAAMRAIKSALDPKGIMNPGAVLRA